MTSLLIDFHECCAEVFKNGVLMGYAGCDRFVPNEPVDTKLLIQAQEVIEKAMQAAYKSTPTPSAISEQTVQSPS